MQKLLLMRHAKSDWPDDGRPDFERPLNKRGRRTAPAVGKWLKREKLRPDVFVCSPAARARETALLVAEALKFPDSEIVFESRIYDAVPGTLVAVLERVRGSAGVVLLVGHNPGLDQALTWLSAEPPPEDEEGRMLTTAAVAVLETAAGKPLDPQSCRLQVLRRPRDAD
jgi:phosphohistidine phosphatase